MHINAKKNHPNNDANEQSDCIYLNSSHTARFSWKVLVDSLLLGVRVCTNGIAATFHRHDHKKCHACPSQGVDVIQWMFRCIVPPWYVQSWMQGICIKNPLARSKGGRNDGFVYKTRISFIINQKMPSTMSKTKRSICSQRSQHHRRSLSPISNSTLNTNILIASRSTRADLVKIQRW